MDPAQKLERDILSLQDPMNAVIDKGDSPVQQFYDGTTVFVTGGSGFMGKLLVEKLLRACAIKKIYLLLRSKKGKSMQERIQHVLSDPVFDTVRNKQPKFVDKVVALEGDAADIKLGLNEKNWNMLTKEVNIIFHFAATINFEDPLTKATFINVRGTREVVTLARGCTKLKKFIHVSTAFCHATKDRIDTDVNEDFYPCPLAPETMIELAESLEKTRLDNITKALINGWPNTYTFTKALAENLIKNSTEGLSVCIVRPPIVLPTYCEPGPGWLDLRTILGPSGILFGAALGALRVFYTNVDAKFPIIPADYVNNVIIASAWDSSVRSNNGDDVPIYHIKKYLQFGYVEKVLRKHKYTLTSNKSIYFGDTTKTYSKLLYFLLSWFYHFIPAYILDFVGQKTGTMPKEVKSFVDLYSKMDKLGAIYDYFMNNHWNFKEDNLIAMITRMNAADKEIFNCDASRIDIDTFILAWALGLRKYIVKDGLTGTAEGIRKQKILFYVHYFIVLPSYLYVWYWVISTIYVLLSHLINLFL